MTSVEVALIGFDNLLNVLRWVELGFLALLTIILFINRKKLASKRPACAALVVTIIAAPFLILQLITHTIEPLPPEEPTPVNPVPHKDPEPEPLPEKDDEPISYIIPVVPSKKSEEQSKPSDSGEKSEEQSEPSDPEKEKHEERDNEEEKKDDKKEDEGEGESETDPVVPDVPVVPDETVAYLVINRKMDISGEDYDVDEVEEFDGYAGDVVTAKVKDYEGFTAPAEKTFTLNEDEHKMVVYDYGRNKYDFTLGDEENTVSSMPAGNYYYGTEISLSAKTRAGYNFVGWSNGEQDQDISLTLKKDTEITPEYEKGPNSVYTVIHKRQNMNGEYGDEDLTEVEELEAKTGTTVTAAMKDYAGFKTPTAQDVEVTIDDAAEVTYYYERESYEFTLNNVARVDYKTHDPGSYYYGTEITVRADRVNPGKVFKQWSNGETALEYSFTLTGDTELEPIYEDADDMPTVFKIDGECQFNGILPTNLNNYMTKTNPITGDECADAHENFVGQNAINTHVKLFSEENISKDFVVSIEIAEFDTEKNSKRATLVGGTLEREKDDNNNKIQWPGIVVRRYENNDNQFLIGSNTTYWKTATSAVRDKGIKVYKNIETTKKITIVRKQGKICYAVKDDYSDGYGQFTWMNTQKTNPYTFDTELYFGASYEEVNGEWTTTKYGDMKLQNLEIRIGTDTAGELAGCH